MAELREGTRLRYAEELEQLRLQVEMMGVRVDENLERTRRLLVDPDQTVAAAALAADDEIDAMNLSLTERCHELLARETPVASDLRLVLSVIRILNELERIGDLALRVVNAVVTDGRVLENPETLDVLQSMADEALELYRLALRAWSTQSLELAAEVAGRSRTMDLHFEQLMDRLMALEGPDAVPLAVQSFYCGRALERIADHAAIIGARLRYLITGEPSHLAAEVR